MGKSFERRTMKGVIKAISRKQFERKVREINGLTIVFWEKDTIYIKDEKYPTPIIANRWYAPKGFYGKCWNPFQTELKNREDLNDIFDIISVANTYDIGIITANKMPDYSNIVKI